MNSTKHAGKEVCRENPTHHDWIFTLASFPNTSRSARDRLFPLRSSVSKEQGSSTDGPREVWVHTHTPMPISIQKDSLSLSFFAAPCTRERVFITEQQR